MNRPRLVSAVYGQGPAMEPCGLVAEERNRRARAALWHKRGIVVLDPEDIADEWFRQAVLNYANDAYGRRGRR